LLKLEEANLVILKLPGGVFQGENPQYAKEIANKFQFFLKDFDGLQGKPGFGIHRKNPLNHKNTI